MPPTTEIIKGYIVQRRICLGDAGAAQDGLDGARNSGSSGYDVTMRVVAFTSYVDGNGNGKETSGHINNPIPVDVFAQAKDGKEANEKVLHLEKRRVADDDSTIALHVHEKPY